MSGKTDPYVSYSWLSHPDAKAPRCSWQPLSDAMYWERPSRAPERRPLLGTAPEWADDLQRIARAVYAADRCTRRDKSFDRWTRHIRLSVPVATPDRWHVALPHVTSLLETTTGDLWAIKFEDMDTNLPQLPLPFSFDDFAHEVALFSDGLDSLSWAAQRATVRTRSALLSSRSKSEISRSCRTECSRQ